MKKVLFIFLLLFFICPIFVLAEQIDINSATLSQLDELTGIGPVYAQRIIDGRTYSSVDDLLRVKGIGPATLQKIKSQGWACVNCETSLTNQTTTQPQAAQTTTDQTNNQTPTTTDATQTSDAQSPAPATIPAIVYPSGVYINEILPNPQGEDSLDEWIELKNSNNSDVDLSGWQLQDQQGTITTYTIPQNTKILAGGFLIFKRPDTKIMLNNDSDGLNLLTPDGKTEDSMNFLSAPLNQSYNKTSSGSPRSEAGWQWSTTMTPRSVNIITAVATSAKSNAGTLPKTTKSDNNKITTAAADLSLPAQALAKAGGDNPWLLFFSAVAAAIILAAIVLFIKLKLHPAKH